MSDTHVPSPAAPKDPVPDPVALAKELCRRVEHAIRDGADWGELRSIVEAAARCGTEGTAHALEEAEDKAKQELLVQVHREAEFMERWTLAVQRGRRAP